MPRINDVPYTTSMYIARAFDRRIEPTLEKLAERTNRYFDTKARPDACVFTGLSGCLVGVRFARLIGANPGAIRKPGESCHGQEYEGPGIVRNYIIIDDFISGGSTCNRIFDTMKRFHPGAKLLAVVLWNVCYTETWTRHYNAYEDHLGNQVPAGREEYPVLTLHFDDHSKIWDTGDDAGPF